MITVIPNDGNWHLITLQYGNHYLVQNVSRQGYCEYSFFSNPQQEDIKEFLDEEVLVVSQNIYIRFSGEQNGLIYTRELQKTLDDYLEKTEGYTRQQMALYFLQKNNTSPFIPVHDYNPATKKYVDDNKQSLYSYQDYSDKETLIPQERNFKDWVFSPRRNLQNVFITFIVPIYTPERCSVNCWIEINDDECRDSKVTLMSTGESNNIIVCTANVRQIGTKDKIIFMVFVENGGCYTAKEFHHFQQSKVYKIRGEL